MSQATLKKAPALTPEERRAALEKELAIAAATAALDRRQEIAKELSECTLPNIADRQREMAAEVARLMRELEEAKLAIRKSDGARMFLAAAQQERRQTLVRELLQTCNPRITTAIEKLQGFISQNALRGGHGLAVAQAQTAANELESLKLLPLDDSAVEKQVAKILRAAEHD